MTSYVPPDAFNVLNLAPEADKQAILKAAVAAMRARVHDMKTIAHAQKLLLDPDSRFLIEFLYYPNFIRSATP